MRRAGIIQFDEDQRRRGTALLSMVYQDGVRGADRKDAVERALGWLSEIVQDELTARLNDRASRLEHEDRAGLELMRSGLSPTAAARKFHKQGSAALIEATRRRWARKFPRTMSETTETEMAE